MTPKQLADATGCSMGVALEWANPITTAVRYWDIVKVAEFVAQCAHESMRFLHLEESLNYRTAERIVTVWPSRFTLETAAKYVNSPAELANVVYADRMGNGDERSGDGWFFRGRGLLQISGRANYARYEAASSVPVTSAPWRLLQPYYAADSAAWYWSDRGIDRASDVAQITRAVNGSQIGLDKRAELTERALRALA